MLGGVRYRNADIAVPGKRAITGHIAYVAYDRLRLLYWLCLTCITSRRVRAMPVFTVKSPQIKAFILISIFLFATSFLGILYFGNKYGVKSTLSMVSIIATLVSMIPVTCSLFMIGMRNPERAKALGEWLEANRTIFVFVFLPLIFISISYAVRLFQGPSMR